MTTKARYGKDGSILSRARFRESAFCAFALAVSGCESVPARVENVPCGYRVVAGPNYAYAIPATWNVKQDEKSSTTESPYVGVMLEVEPSRDDLATLRTRYVEQSKRGHSYVDSADRTVSDGAAFLIETRYIVDSGTEIHRLSLVTAAGGKVFNFVCGAHEREWTWIEPICRAVIDSFAVTR